VGLRECGPKEVSIVPDALELGDSGIESMRRDIEQLSFNEVDQWIYGVLFACHHIRLPFAKARWERKVSTAAGGPGRPSQAPVAALKERGDRTIELGFAHDWLLTMEASGSLEGRGVGFYANHALEGSFEGPWLGEVCAPK
jgi:hypothetical protein